MLSLWETNKMMCSNDRGARGRRERERVNNGYSLFPLAVSKFCSSKIKQYTCHTKIQDMHYLQEKKPHSQFT